jgi:integrase
MSATETIKTKAASAENRRRYLRPDEANRLIKAAGEGRWGNRDAAIVRMMFRHGLRVGEAVRFRWDHVDLDRGTLHVVRLKNGSPSMHTMDPDEIRGLRRLKAKANGSPTVFLSERGGPLSVDAVQRLVRAAGVRAGLEVPAHPHMLRHAAGYAGANDGVDTRTLQGWLGHKCISQTVKYTELSTARLASVRIR